MTLVSASLGETCTPGQPKPLSVLIGPYQQPPAPVVEKRRVNRRSSWGASEGMSRLWLGKRTDGGVDAVEALKMATSRQTISAGSSDGSTRVSTASSGQGLRPRARSMATRWNGVPQKALAYDTGAKPQLGQLQVQVYGPRQHELAHVHVHAHIYVSYIHMHTYIHMHKYEAEVSRKVHYSSAAENKACVYSHMYV